MCFLICSNVHDSVTNFEFVDLCKTHKSKYLEKETQFLPLIKKIINCTLRALLWQKICQKVF